MLIEFAFHELSLEIRPDGFGAAEVEGIADIDFSAADCSVWKVAAIKVHLSKRVGSGLVYRTEAPSKAHADAIELTLLTHPKWRARVQERVDAAWADARLASHEADPGFRRSYTRATQI